MFNIEVNLVQEAIRLHSEGNKRLPVRVLLPLLPCRHFTLADCRCVLPIVAFRIAVCQSSDPMPVTTSMMGISISSAMLRRISGRPTACG